MDTKAMTKFQQWARDNFKAPYDINEMWHPEIQAECEVIKGEIIADMEAEKAKRRAEKERIREVVEKTADINAELAGRIVVRVSFAGSLPKTKKLTKEERKIVLLPDTLEAKQELSMALVGADKKLWASKEYDELASFVSTRRDEFAKLGIPHIKFQSAHVVDITRIPEIDELAAKTEREMAELVEKLIAVYPSQITPEATKLGPLYNARDYATAESLKGMFKFDYDWLAFGIPEELKQFDKRIYEKAKAKAEKVWAEIQANGVLLLRETVNDLVSGLVDSLTPKDGGEKKKFYASSVTKITDFIDSFKARNICNDVELDAEVEKLRGLVSGIDLKAMSSDTKLRESVKKDMESVKGSLDQLLVSASARTITYE